MARFAATMCLGFFVLTACEGPTTFPGPPGTPTDAELRQTLSNWGVIPIGQMPAQDPAKVALGQALFFDKILSGNRDVACATCHDPMTFLGDGRSLPIGTGGTGSGPDRVLGPGRQLVPRGAPSLLNSGLGLFYMFLDGRLSGRGSGPFLLESDNIHLTAVPNILAAQAMLPVLNRVEMRGVAGDIDVLGNSNELANFADDQHTDIWQAVMDRLMATPEYVQMFGAAFPGTPASSLGFQHAAEALAVYEMEAFTKTNSPFDRYLNRDNDALSAEAKLGAFLFTGEAQCVTCHNGPFLGGDNFANVGAPQVGPGIGKRVPLDLGRGELDNSDFYRFAFRVVPLRNVELTAPYMHSGAYPTLEAVVEHYSDVLTAMREYDVSQLDPALRSSFHGDDTTIDEIMETLDFRLTAALDFTEDEKSELVAFLESLTDPSARDLSSLIPARVPSELPVR